MPACSLLAKPLILDMTKRVSAAGSALSAELTLGVAELVECVIDRLGPASFLGVPLEKNVRDYCKVCAFVVFFSTLLYLEEEILLLICE